MSAMIRAGRMAAVVVNAGVIGVYATLEMHGSIECAVFQIFSGTFRPQSPSNPALCSHVHCDDRAKGIFAIDLKNDRCSNGRDVAMHINSWSRSKDLMKLCDVFIHIGWLSVT